MPECEVTVKYIQIQDEATKPEDEKLNTLFSSVPSEIL